MRIGVQLCQQHCTLSDLRRAWCVSDDEGLDSIFLWDHFFPLSGEPNGASFEPWTLLAAMAVETRSASIGPLVSAIPFRSPDLVADMARTIQLLSGGRFVLGIGAGWFERDFVEYGIEFRSLPDRLAHLEDGVRRIRKRLAALRPSPMPPVPILIGGNGTRTTLGVVARNATSWNCIGTPEAFAQRNRALDAWCHRVGRDPGDIERSVLIGLNSLDLFEKYVAAGANHVIVALDAPFELAPVIALRQNANAL